MLGDPARRPKAVVIRIRRKPKGQKKLFAAVALVAYLVQPGDTLSGIATSHGASLNAVKSANQQLYDPNLIYAGQTVRIPEGSSAWQRSSAPQSYPGSHPAADSGGQSAPAQQSAPSATSPPSVAGAVTQSGSSGSSSAPASTPSAPASASSSVSASSLADVPGVPEAFAACVAYRESTDLQNPAADGNAYGIIPASGYDVYGTSLANQKQVFAELYAQYGGAPWAADGCPGT
jgi:LysM repeat protein